MGSYVYETHTAMLWFHPNGLLIETGMVRLYIMFLRLTQDLTGVLVEGNPIGLEEVHSFTLGCLLCNPVGCYGDSML